MINSVSGYGSTGSICTDIAMELEYQGHECFIAYGQISKGYTNEFKIGSRLENHIHNLGSRILGKQGYFSKNGTRKLVEFIKSYNPDVIHLHNLHGNYLNLEILFTFLSTFNGKVVLTLHDCWAFTGKCSHYTDVGCYKWQTVCNNCPQLAQYPPSLFLDFSNTMFLDKKRWFGSIKNLKIQPVSKWLEKEVKKSFLKNNSIHMVYNWVDHTIFKPSVGVDLVKYNLKPNKFTILFVSAGWHPGSVRWDDLMLLASQLSDEYQLLVVGENKYKSKLPSNCIAIDYINGKEELAKIYSFADVYIHLSTEDTFGKVIVEALSCGTPAIVYNSTACGEIVNSKCGFVVEKRNIQQIIASVKSIQKTTKLYFSKSSIKYVEDFFDMKTNVNQIINIYKK